jgi:DNA repair protein RecO
MADSTRYRGIIVGVSKTGEQSKAVDILTDESGLIHCVARNAVKSRKRFAGSLEPFTSGDFQVKPSTRYRPTLESIDNVVSRFNISQSLGSFYFASYACQWMKTIVRDAESIHQWYSLLMALLDSLCFKGCTTSQVFWFELVLLKYGGVLVDPSSCPLCDKKFDDRSSIVFDDRDGIFIHHDHDDSAQYPAVDGGVYKMIKMLTVVDFEGSQRIKPSVIQVGIMSSLLKKLLIIHYGSLPSGRESLFNFL